MPPRRKAAAKAAPPPPPLEGCKIALSGTFPGRTQATIERDFMTPLGASLVKSVTASTTHLVATEVDYRKPSTKVQAAQAHDVPIVTFQWLEDTQNQMTKVNEKMYGFDSSQSQHSQSQVSKPQTTQTNGSRKRAAAAQTPAVNDGNDDDDSQSHPKKKSRALEDKLQKQEAKEAKVADGQIAKSFDIRIPIDEGAVNQFHNYEVYIDDTGVIYDASLNQTNATNNNNKFYRVQLLRSVSGDYRTWTRWGRVGEHGQTKALGNGTLANALREFESKFKAKSGLTWSNRAEPPLAGKYAFIERSYEPDSEDEDDKRATDGVTIKDEPQEEPESKLSKPVQELMQLIFNQQYFAATMADLNYDAAKLPLGKLSKSTITRGFQALKDLSALLDDPSLAQSRYETSFPLATEHLSNLYFTLIPHELLESLGDMKDASLVMKSEQKEVINMLDQQFQGLGMREMTPLSRDSTEFIELKNYLTTTRGSTHNANYQVSQIFRIERQGETERLDAVHGPPRDRRLLWHGSRCTNFGGILSQGLRIAPPEAPVSGYMFGKGIYLADMSSKSANYCCPYISNGHALLLLCEAELGDPLQELLDASYNAGEDAKAKGMLSTWGQGRTGPSCWKDAECVHPSLKGIKIPDSSVEPGPTGARFSSLLYNEYICYDISQVRLRYLLRVRM
ncbi:PARP-domain-containing protein [Xylariaceae sp. FL0662B]|nr:PARP-domain-containing protein [Xylariaceae sp. FL0662B]